MPHPYKLPVGERPAVASLAGRSPTVSVLNLGPMYATDRRQTRIIA